MRRGSPFLYPRLFTQVLASYALRQSHGCPLAQAWQAMRRKAKRHAVWLDLQASVRVVRREDRLTLWEIAGERYWAPRESRVLPGLLEELSSGMYDSEAVPLPGDAVLDCGAHIGTFALTALGRGAGRVIAIEPAPDNIECLRRNLAEPIAARRATVYPAGVWEREDLLVLRVKPRNPAADSFTLHLRGSQPGPRVQVVTIDALVDELHLDRVDHIKMDVEGAECQALAGGLQTLRRWRPRLAIATEHRRDDPERIPEFVKSIEARYRVRNGPWVLGRHALRPQMLYFS